MTSAGFVRSVRRRLDAMTDYDKRLRERWVADWADGLEPRATVLDVGAGDAHLASPFRRQRYLALDIDPEPSPRRVTTIIGDGLRLPFKDGSVSHVLSIQVLEHVTDPQAALLEMARILPSGGTICLSIPQSDPEHEQPRDYFRFTSFSLRALLTRSGLEPIILKKKGGYFRRLSAEIRDLPFIVLPEDRSYRWPSFVFFLRALLVVTCTFMLATFLLLLDPLDKAGTYTTGYFCIARKRS
jgi:ubiquinone/menaquinone biosynthesis C-methylase UbiE